MLPGGRSLRRGRERMLWNGLWRVHQQFPPHIMEVTCTYAGQVSSRYLRLASAHACKCEQYVRDCGRASHLCRGAAPTSNLPKQRHTAYPLSPLFPTIGPGENASQYCATSRPRDRAVPSGSRTHSSASPNEARYISTSRPYLSHPQSFALPPSPST